MYEQEFLEPSAYISASSNPGVMQAVLDYVIDGLPLSYAHRAYLDEDAALWRKSLKVCLSDEGYVNPEAQQRFAELARDLKYVDAGKKPYESPSAQRFSTEQAITFREYLAKEGRCNSLKKAFSVGDPKTAESQRKQCQACVARVACAEYALIFNENHGMWGGMSERARRRTRSKIRRDFEVESIERELAYYPIDSDIRERVRQQIPLYLATADKEAYRGPGRTKKADKQTPKN